MHIHCMTQTLFNSHVHADPLKYCPTAHTQVLSPFSPTTHSPPGHCVEQVSIAKDDIHRET